MEKEGRKTVNLGARVANAIRECGLKQYEVAEKLNYTPTYLSNIVNGRRPVTPEFAEKLSEFLNTVHGLTEREVFLNFLDLDEDEQRKAIANGFKEGDEVQTVVKEKFYDPCFFLGIYDTPNFLLEADKYMQEIDEYSKLVSAFLYYLGYEIVKMPPTIFDNSFRLPFNMLKKEISDSVKDQTENSRYVYDKAYLKIRKIKTKETIDISYLDYKFTMNAICDVINRQIQTVSVRNQIDSLLTKQETQS